MKLAVYSVTLVYFIVALVIFNKVTTALERSTLTGGIGTPAEMFMLHVREDERARFKNMYLINKHISVIGVFPWHFGDFTVYLCLDCDL